MGIFLRAIFGLAVLLVAAGCSFENPLSGPSKDLNTWLLGVWEHKDDKGKLYRTTVTPRTGDTMWVNVQILGKTRSQTKTYVFKAWISRVGYSRFLSMECVESAGQVPEGQYVFAHYQVLDQNHVRIRIPEINVDPAASSYQLRKEVRARLKDNTLYPDTGSTWERISEVYWAEGDEPQPFQPLRYPEPEAPRE